MFTEESGLKAVGDDGMDDGYGGLSSGEGVWLRRVRCVAWENFLPCLSIGR